MPPIQTSQQCPPLDTGAPDGGNGERDERRKTTGTVESQSKDLLGMEFAGCKMETGKRRG